MTASSGTPATGYKWPSATAGNELALKHGGHVERRWRPLAEQLAAEAIEACPWLRRPGFKWSVEAWATAEARAQLVDVWLDEQATAAMPGDLDAGEPRAASALSGRFHARAESLRARLGMDPNAMARLLASFSGGNIPGGDDVLAALRAEGRRLVAAHDAGPALPPATANGADHNGRGAETAAQVPENGS
jgi:hypothetical protein